MLLKLSELILQFARWDVDSIDDVRLRKVGNGSNIYNDCIPAVDQFCCLLRGNRAFAPYIGQQILG